jgi:hypothetical protein
MQELKEEFRKIYGKDSGQGIDKNRKKCRLRG